MPIDAREKRLVDAIDGDRSIGEITGDEPHVQKWIGAFAAALAGVDTLVFAGGIGENVPVVRARICERLAFLGIELDPARNASNAPIVSPDRGRTGVRVIRTDEEAMIAQAIVRVVGRERIEHPARSRSPS